MVRRHRWTENLKDPKQKKSGAANVLATADVMYATCNPCVRGTHHCTNGETRRFELGEMRNTIALSSITTSAVSSAVTSLLHCRPTGTACTAAGAATIICSGLGDGSTQVGASVSFLPTSLMGGGVLRRVKA